MMANFDPGDRRAGPGVRTARLRIARWSLPTATTSVRGWASSISSNDQTVLRGGYGMFYNFLDRIGSEDQLALNPPGLRNINIRPVTTATTPVLILREGFPANYLDPSNIVLSRLLIRAANPSGENALNHQFAAASSGRSDASSSSLPTSSATSAATSPCCGTSISRLNGNGARPYPGFAHIQWRDPVGDSRILGRRPLGGEAIRPAAELPRGLYAVGATRRGARASGGDVRTAAEHQRHRRRGKARATSTSATGSSATSLRSCRSARISRISGRGCGCTAGRLDGQRHLHRANGPSDSR